MSYVQITKAVIIVINMRLYIFLIRSAALIWPRFPPCPVHFSCKTDSRTLLVTPAGIFLQMYMRGLSPLTTNITIPKPESIHHSWCFRYTSVYTLLRNPNILLLVPYSTAAVLITIFRPDLQHHLYGRYSTRTNDSICTVRIPTPDKGVLVPNDLPDTSN